MLMFSMLRKRPGTLLISLLMGAASCAFSLHAQQASAPPTAQLDNGRIQATVYLPDAKNGFYKGTRFDWAGIIGKLTAGGHTYYDRWFTAIDPSVNDYVWQGHQIIAGPDSSATGVPEEFTADDNLGYTIAPVGGTFIKIGVGVLRKPAEPSYDKYAHYEIVDGGKRTVKATKTSIAFTQDLIDTSTGYGYLYTKTIRLIPNTSQMVLEHTLKNTGTKAIHARVYDHNFLTLDHQLSGPEFTVTTRFPITPKQPINAEFGSVEGNVIRYNRVLEDKEIFRVDMGGYGNTASDYDFLIQNKKLDASVRIQGDRPLDRAALWSINAALSVEPFIALSIEPGQQTDWKYTYTFGPARKP